MPQYHWIVSNSRDAALAEAQRRNFNQVFTTSGHRSDTVDASFLDHDAAADEAVGLERIFNTNFGRHRGDETTKFLEELDRNGNGDPVAFITIVQDHSIGDFHWAELMEKWVIYFSALDDVTKRRIQTLEGQLLGSKTILNAATVTALNEVDGKVRSKSIKALRKDRSREPRQSRPNDRPRTERKPGPGRELATSMSGRPIEVSKPRRGQEPDPKFHERNAPKPVFHEKPAVKKMEGPSASSAELQDWQKKLSGHFGGNNG